MTGVHRRRSTVNQRCVDFPISQRLYVWIVRGANHFVICSKALHPGRPDFSVSSKAFGMRDCIILPRFKRHPIDRFFQNPVSWSWRVGSFENDVRDFEDLVQRRNTKKKLIWGSTCGWLLSTTLPFVHHNRRLTVITTAYYDKNETMQSFGTLAILFFFYNSFVHEITSLSKYHNAMQDSII